MLMLTLLRGENPNLTHAHAQFKRGVHYYKVRANHTIQIGATANSQSLRVSNERTGKKMHTFISAHPHPHVRHDARPLDPLPNRAYVTRDGQPTTCMPCLLRG
jgi:hypothetical protein